ncbi:MAG: LytR C-terminal domain-containing protein [Rhodothermales bacterium]|nr:LytR C-terminal domain-containing protein [Rhodothermales bacterium]MBO6780376.1 LytR C-terminal domain-containing protein [Rhodothermales bacterium]
MGLLTERMRNMGLNAGLVVAGVAALALLYALVVRWTGPDPAPLGRAVGDIGDIIQVDVRNGCGVSGLADRMTDYLRDHGFDVVEAGNHSSYDESSTYVLDRIGNPRAAEALARAVGLPADRVREDIQPDYFLDATIVIGADYAAIHPFSETDGATAPCQ